MDLHVLFLTLGALLLIGLITDEIGRRTRLPRVTLLILFGVAAGSSGLDLLPRAFQDWYEFLASVALTMVAFLLGGKLSFATLRSHGKTILAISLTVVILTALLVGIGLIAIQIPVPMALLLAGIATATAPAAIQDVVRQTGAKGPFTDTLLAVVAVDDAWGLVVFSLLLAVAIGIAGDGTLAILGHGLWELGGALAVGAAVGLPAAFLTGRLKPGEPMQAEALGLVFLCAGLAIWLGVSFLLAGMVAGATVVNLAKHHSRPFHEIEHIERPFMVFFFVLAGASLRLDSLYDIGLIGLAYLVLRILARLDWRNCGRRPDPAPALDWSRPHSSGWRGAGHGSRRSQSFSRSWGDTVGGDSRHLNCIRSGWADSYATGLAKGWRSRMRNLLAASSRWSIIDRFRPRRKDPTPLTCVNAATLSGVYQRFIQSIRPTGQKTNPNGRQSDALPTPSRLRAGQAA